MRRSGGALLAAMLSLAAGCSLSPPKPADYEYYVLTPIEREAAEQVPATNRIQAPGPPVPILVVGRVTIPDYLVRDAMVTRVSEHQLTYSSRDRWAEPLEDGLARSLRQNLGLLLEQRVLVEPSSLATVPDYNLRVDVLRFEQLGDDRVELWARYTISAAGTLAYSGETHLVAPAGSGARGATEALSGALGRMSREIAEAVLALGQR